MESKKEDKTKKEKSSKKKKKKKKKKEDSTGDGELKVSRMLHRRRQSLPKSHALKFFMITTMIVRRKPNP